MEKRILGEEELERVKTNLENNLEVFQRKFILFFAGLCCFAVGIVINAFGATWGTLLLLAGMGAWAAPLVIKFWFSGVGSLFDFQYKTYEIDSYGNKRDVSGIDSVLVGPFLKCAAALIVAVVALYLAPAEIVVRFLNHLRLERKLGLKGTVKDAPRREVILSVIVVVAMIVLACIGSAVATIAENTSDISKDQIVQLLETVESKKSYKILGYYDYSAETNYTYAEITEKSDGVTVKVQREFNINTYLVPVGTYEYKDGKWTGADEALSKALTQCVLGLNFDFEAMKSNADKIVVNKDNGLGGRIDGDTHDYYRIDSKKNSDLEFNSLYVEMNFKFLENYYLVYVFD